MPVSIPTGPTPSQRAQRHPPPPPLLDKPPATPVPLVSFPLTARACAAAAPCALPPSYSRRCSPSHGFPENEGLPSEAAALKNPQPWRYFTGETRELLDDMPMLEALRDIVLVLKMFMAPSRDQLPPERQWHVSDAIPVWTSTKEGQLLVSAFGRTLDLAYGSTGGEAGSSRDSAGAAKSSAQRGGWFRSLFRSHAHKPRAPFSAADPSILAGATVVTEDDVLHLKALPDFNQRLTPTESEHLLQILTVPYLRIPLLLAFFTPQHRVTLLAEPLIQETLDASLFEPAMWQPDSTPTHRPDSTAHRPRSRLTPTLRAAPDPIYGSVDPLALRAIALRALV